MRVSIKLVALKRSTRLCRAFVNECYNPVKMSFNLSVVYFIYLVIAANRCLIQAETGNTSCPTWFYYNNISGQCECRQLNLWGIRCHQHENKAEIANGFCLTFDQKKVQYYAADCVYSHGNTTNRIYAELPHDPAKVNDFMCGPFNRKGFLCGKCIDGYGPAVFSLATKCVNCSKFSVVYATGLYLLLEIVPIGIFFFSIVILRINITAGPLLGYVIFCQVYAYSVQRNVYIASYIISNSSEVVQVLLYCSLALCGVWNLKFAWLVIPPFCISNNLTGIHIQLLGLIPPIVPIILFIITCIIIDLHGRNNLIFTRFRNLFANCPVKFKVDGNAVFHAFATFLFLSAYTLNYVMIITITANSVFYGDGRHYDYTPFCDPTIVWLSHKHIAYISIAFITYIALVLIPSLIICVYPSRVYLQLSKFISARKKLAITTFVEALHNCFKDGLDGTRDFRLLAGVNMVIGVLYALFNFSLWYMFGTGYSLSDFSGFTLIILSLIISYVRPCKTLLANVSLSYHIMAMGILSIGLGHWNEDLSTGTEVLIVIFTIIPIISHIVVISWSVYMIIRWLKSHPRYQRRRSNPEGT